MTIGLLILALLVTIYSRTISSNLEFQRSNSQLENGRFALQLLSQDILLAGFWGEYVPTGFPATPGVIDPCSHWPDSGNYQTNDSWAKNVMMQPLMGYHGALPGGGCISSSDQQAGTDILVSRHADNCDGSANSPCTIAANQLYLQVSGCFSQQATSPYYFGIAAPTASKPGTANPVMLPLSLTQKDCASAALRRAYVSDIYWIRKYFVSPSENPAIPTLMLTSCEPSTSSCTTQPLVEGIEQLQVEYGIDTDNNGSPDSYLTADSITTPQQWNQVVTARIYLVARNSSTSPGYTDNKTYNLGPGASAWTPASGSTGYKRHVYSTVITLVNPASRKF